MNLRLRVLVLPPPLLMPPTPMKNTIPTINWMMTKVTTTRRKRSLRKPGTMMKVRMKAQKPR